ncbi:MAG TPA: TolC family protein [Rubrivivax sp.]|nr:TolC family protein [Rubrivivax sp.]HPO20592.1 TolC family protein [Rubrivivax sp.]
MKPMPRALFTPAALVLAGALGWAAPAHALDLVDAWRAAQGADMQYAAAQAARQAGEARREQGASLWRPSLQLSGTVGVGNADTSTRGARFSAPGFGTVDGANFDTSINGGTATRWALQARQPLLNRERDAQKRQLELSADVAELEWRAAQQALMLRVAERYFDAALATEALRVQQRQQQAVQRSLAEARDRFQLGDAPVTDTHEAAARAEAVRAEVLAAQTTLELKQSALSDVTGWSGAQLQSLRAGIATLPRNEQPLDSWLAEAKAGNLGLRMQAASVEVAAQEAARHSIGAAPTLDLVASVGQDRLSGSGDFGSATNSQTNAIVGVQLNLPLYTGGWRSAREDESLRLVAKASAEGEHQAQQVALHTRAAWLGLTVGASRVAALQEALVATRARLDATRIGRQVGERTTLELLNAENDAAAAELALLQARVAVLLDRLRLAALAGKLDEAELQQLNANLLPAPAPAPAPAPR